MLSVKPALTGRLLNGSRYTKIRKNNRSAKSCWKCRIPKRLSWPVLKPNRKNGSTSVSKWIFPGGDYGFRGCWGTPRCQPTILREKRGVSLRKTEVSNFERFSGLTAILPSPIPTLLTKMIGRSAPKCREGWGCKKDCCSVSPASLHAGFALNGNIPRAMPWGYFTS